MNERVSGLGRKSSDIVRINLEGDPTTVSRWLIALANAEQGNAGAAVARDPDPLLLTRDQAAKRLGRSTAYISQLVREGSLKNYGSDTAWRISGAELAALVEGER